MGVVIIVLMSLGAFRFITNDGRRSTDYAEVANFTNRQQQLKSIKVGGATYNACLFE